MSEKIVNRQVVNIAFSAGVLNPVNIGLNLRFIPDAVILRQSTYSTVTTPSAGNSYQIYCDLILDQILCMFHDLNSMSAPNSTFMIRPNFMSGNVQFQIQDTPVVTATGSRVGTGPSGLTATGDGAIGLILEFVKYER